MSDKKPAGNDVTTLGCLMLIWMVSGFMGLGLLALFAALVWGMLH